MSGQSNLSSLSLSVLRPRGWRRALACQGPLTRAKVPPAAPAAKVRTGTSTARSGGGLRASSSSLAAVNKTQRYWRLYELLCRASNGPDILIRYRRYWSNFWY